MKKAFLLTLILFCFGNSIIAQNYKKEAQEARDPKFECFIQLKDSSILRYNVLKYKTPPLSYGYLEGDGERLNYQVEDVLCFQDLKGYWLRTSLPGNEIRIGKLPFSYFFAVRIRNGKIELYGQYATNGRGVSDAAYESGWNYFIRKNNQIYGLDKWGVNLKNAVKDNKGVYNDFDDAFGKGRIKNVIEIIDSYN